MSYWHRRGKGNKRLSLNRCTRPQYVPIAFDLLSRIVELFGIFSKYPYVQFDHWDSSFAHPTGDDGLSDESETSVENGRRGYIQKHSERIKRVSVTRLCVFKIKNFFIVLRFRFLRSFATFRIIKDHRTQTPR